MFNIRERLEEINFTDEFAVIHQKQTRDRGDIIEVKNRLFLITKVFDDGYNAYPIDFKVGLFNNGDYKLLETDTFKNKEYIVRVWNERFIKKDVKSYSIDRVRRLSILDRIAGSYCGTADVDEKSNILRAYISTFVCDFTTPAK